MNNDISFWFCHVPHKKLQAEPHHPPQLKKDASWTKGWVGTEPAGHRCSLGNKQPSQDTVEKQDLGTFVWQSLAHGSPLAKGKSQKATRKKKVKRTKISIYPSEINVPARKPGGFLQTAQLPPLSPVWVACHRGRSSRWLQGLNAGGWLQEPSLQCHPIRTFRAEPRSRPHESFTPATLP